MAASAIGLAVAPLFVVPAIFQGLGEVVVDPVVFGAMPPACRPMDSTSRRP
jgi:hypothetical protein